MFRKSSSLTNIILRRTEYIREIIRKRNTAAAMAQKFKLPCRYGSGEKSVWVEYIQLVAETKPAVNLGQGFCDYPIPSHIPKALADATTGSDPLMNQYTRGYGHPRLVNAVAKLYSKLINRNIDPMKEVLIGVGAYESLYCAILGHVDEGDEVIVIEPFFDCYDFMIRMAGGIPKFIPLQPKGFPKADAEKEDDYEYIPPEEFKAKKQARVTSSDWVLDEKQLRKLFNVKTKMIIVNTPHNPVGKVFTKEELELIASLCKEYNVLCVADEVYEWLVYKPKQHFRIATLPDMWERTITIGSAGKTFSVTGWKIGWAYGPEELMKNLQVVHQNCIYTCCTPVQEAVARSFEFEMARMDLPECYFNSLPNELVAKRDLLVDVLKNNGFNPTVPDGGFFIIADWSKLEEKLDLLTESDKCKDYRFTKKLCKEGSVLAIPPSAFYSAKHKKLAENYARFCFIKKDEVLKQTDTLLKAWNKKVEKDWAENK